MRNQTRVKAVGGVQHLWIFCRRRFARLASLGLIDGLGAGSYQRHGNSHSLFQLGGAHMSEPLHFEDLAIGDCWTSLGRTVTETDVVNFAGITGDFDPLHVDHEFAPDTLWQTDRPRSARFIVGSGTGQPKSLRAHYCFYED